MTGMEWMADSEYHLQSESMGDDSREVTEQVTPVPTGQARAVPTLSAAQSCLTAV